MNPQDDDSAFLGILIPLIGVMFIITVCLVSALVTQCTQ